MAKHTDKILFIILFGIIIIQTTLIPQLAIYGIVPNLAVAFLIALATANKTKNIFRMTFLTGLILDVFSGLPFGIITAGLILAVFTVSVLSSRFLKSREFFILSPIVFSGLLIYNLALLILSNLGDLPFILENIKQLFPIFILKIIFEIMLALAFYAFALKLKRGC